MQKGWGQRLILATSVVAALATSCGQATETVYPTPEERLDSDTTQTSAPVVVAPSVSISPITESLALASFPDACDIISSEDVIHGVQPENSGVAAEWVGELSPYQLETEELYAASESTCRWTLDQASRVALGMGALSDGSTDVEITVHRYGHVERSGGPGTLAWSDDDPQTLLEEFFASHQEQIGSNAIATFVPDEPLMVQDGSRVIVAGQAVWAELTLYNCHFEVCGESAVSLAKVVQERISTVE